MEISLDAESLQNIFNAVRVNSKSQFAQDMFVLHYHKFKSNGYFIEFGATNGVDLSNSYILEKHFGWKGILAEPAKIWHKDLVKNRSCAIDFRCVWKESGQSLPFYQSTTPDLSTITGFGLDDFNKNQRNMSGGNSYQVPTITLSELLIQNNAPKVIDYLSIDTEGSEFEILNNFNFADYDIKVITCEHNFTNMREAIFNLLSKNGYKRVHEKISNVDDWFVK